ncbi:hypothetical protein HYDPIDRAFT_189160 [Hydnomerulius pinastri MD-312]|uniref:F-box domain-containing protein n=1 Tax=Hydnomerulius pinastri MD-312 TaxID=994086 RepID=A0A0C9W665_9AGAM|nr:hypothetical protein HYDPIDRAFT_189160 [Hydnomerulius pinastri MD-312]
MSSSQTLPTSRGWGHRASPVCKLPNEILSYIFELVTHALSLDEFPVVGDNQQKLPFHPASVTAPTTLSTVNRRWRDLVWANPKLWTSIFVSIDNIIDCGYIREESCFHPSPGRILDVESLGRFLSRSRNSPIDILIDGRDPDWDFPDFFDGGQLVEGCPVDNHPFCPQIMTQILDILFHHVSRWRSLVILTDTWAPMHATIHRLSNPHSDRGSSHSTIGGASCLEALTLMCCNEYIVHSDTFVPPELKEPICNPFAALLDHPSDSLSAASRKLTRLRSVSLLGVHVNWADFASLVSDTCRGLSKGIQTLELSYHCCEVRPSVSDFCRILKGCPNLRSLSLKLSGPQCAEETFEGHAVILPSLEKLHLEYDSSQDAARALSLLRCPNLKTLVAEGVAHVDRGSDDGSHLLMYCSTGSLLIPATPLDNAFPKPASLKRPDTAPRKSPFHLLEDLTLHRITACMTPYSMLFASLPNLRRLTLRHTPTHAIASLLPQQHFCGSQNISEVRMTAPCIRLECLDVTHSEVEAYHVLGFTLKERGRMGAPRVPEVTLHLEGSSWLSGRPLVAMYEEITHLDIIDSSEEDDEEFGLDN